jgi:DNA-dependent protein kinase catalytic subunit
VAAGEVLHSIVLYIIGTHANRRADATPGTFKKIYEHLFPALIQLATDIETVTRQLFEPLMLQIIHWFTQVSTQQLIALTEHTCVEL